MIRSVAACLLLCLSCLLSLPATAQAVKPLSPVVVRLDVGDVIDRPLIGLDTASYAVAVRAVQLVPLSDAALADKDRVLTITRQQLSASLDANRQLVRDLDNRERDYQNLLAAARKVAGKPPARPLLLDWRTYAVFGAGVASEPVIRVGVKAVLGW